jgi:DNA-binding NarL/FixJ family response regulator
MYITIVDDLKSESEKIQDVLLEYSQIKNIHFEIFNYKSGEDFIADFERGKFGIVFMDIYMNGMTGIEAAMKMREIDNRCILIFLTTSTEHMSDAFACRALDYIQKPLDKTRTLKAVSDALDIFPCKLPELALRISRMDIRILYDDFVSAVSNNHTVEITDRQCNVYKPRTVTNFITWADENYSADRYFFIFWNHGAGTVQGYGVDEIYPDDMLDYSGVYSFGSPIVYDGNLDVSYSDVGDYDTIIYYTLTDIYNNSYDTQTVLY